MLMILIPDISLGCSQMADACSLVWVLLSILDNQAILQSQIRALWSRRRIFSLGMFWKAPFGICLMWLLYKYLENQFLGNFIVVGMVKNLQPVQ